MSNVIDLTVLGDLLDISGGDITITPSGNFNVAGSMTADGLTVSSTGGGPVYLQDSDATATYNISELNNVAGNFNIQTRDSAGTFVSTDYQIVKNASGAEYQRWFTQGSERLRIDASGRVGIGTGATVNRALEIAGNNNGGAKANYIRITDTDTSATADNQQGGIEFYTNDDTAGIAASIEVLYAGSGGGGEFTFNTAVNSSAGVVEAMRIDSNGNVGVGTSSPSTYAKFAIRGGLTVNAGSTSLTGVSFSASDAANSTFWITHASATTNLITDAPMAFYTASGSGVAERMRIDSNGNVGIGESSPTAGVKLHVTNALQVNQYLESTGNTTNSILQTGADGNSAYVFNRANAALTFGTNNTERMRIDSQGRVGIKTANPTSLLHIFDGEGGTSAQTDLLTLQTQRSDFGSGGSSILFFDTETPPATSGGNASSRGRIKAYTENADEFQTDFRFSLSDRSDSSITSISADATTITVIHTASVGLGVEVGDYVSIQSTTNFNEDFAVTGVDSNTQFTIAATGYEGFAEETSGNVAKSETFDRMVITGGGNVGIGIDSPSTDALHVVASGLDDDDDTIVLGANFSSASTLGSIGTHHEDVNNGGLKFSSKISGTLTEAMRINTSGTVLFKSGSFPTNQDSPFIYRIGGGSLAIGAATETGTVAHAAFYTNSLERMRIDASGNVGINTTSASRKVEIVDGSDAAIDPVLRLYNPNINVNTGAAVEFAAKNGNGIEHEFADIGGGVSTGSVGAEGGYLRFRTIRSGTMTEAARIDSSGNLLVGKTVNDLTTDGIVLRGSGELFVTRANDVAAFNRKSSDGNIVTFRKDGATVGSIGAGDGDIVVSSRNDKGFKIYAPNADGTSSILHPSTNATGSPLDAKMDLGYALGRFKDLYLSGGVVFGDAGGSGTSSSNSLDSYEEGTWTPTFGATTNPTMTYNTQSAVYTKVGNLVSVTCKIITATRSGGSGQLTVNGLPFTVAANMDGPIYIGFNYNWTTPPNGGSCQQGTNHVLLYSSIENNTASFPADILASGNSYLIFSATYRTNA